MDILDLPGWTVLAKRLEDREYELEAEYTVKPTACQKCGVLDRLYRHGTNSLLTKDAAVRRKRPGRPLRNDFTGRNTKI